MPFDCKGAITSVAPRWKKWKKSFEYYIIAKGITNSARKKGLLLHCAGPEVQELFETLQDPGPAAEGEDVADEFQKALRTLDAHFSAQINEPYERHVFRNLKQEEGETVDQFITRLRRQAENCNWDNADEPIRDQVIDKCKSAELRRKLLLKGTHLTLGKVQEIARSFEAVEIQLKAMKGAEEDQQVNRIEKRETADQFTGRGAKGRCFRCDREGHFSRDSCCPARNAECRRCHKVGHFAKVCQSKNFTSKNRFPSTEVSNKGRSNVNSVDDGKMKAESDDDEYAFTVGGGNAGGMINVLVGGTSLQMLVDSGASTNVIDKGTWEELKSQRIECKSRKCEKKLYAYGSSVPLKVIGCFEAKVVLGDSVCEAEFVVIEGKGQPLLGRSTATELGVLQIRSPINSVSSDIVEEFKDCFTGVGKLKGYQLTLHVKEDVAPVVQPLRRPPFNLRDKIERKLDELESMDIIEKVNSPSRWVSPVVVVPKPNGEVRLCIDMRQANCAVERERYPIPTIDEVLQDMSNSTVFSKLDLRWGYHQIELSEESREITTFITHRGLYRYKRLMFGISSAPEKYQQVIQQTLQDIEGVHNISDDIVVHGSTHEQHDERLRKVMRRLCECGLTLNLEKCQFSTSELTFMGHVLSSRGVGVAADKVKAVVEAREPGSASEVRSFLGLVNYSGRFIPDLATLSEPLRRLTKKGVEFQWGPEQAAAFQKLKDELARAEILGYYDKDAETHVITDASPVGLGAVLAQKQKGEFRVIMYASRSLTEVERRYSQTEREALAIVWACERFHTYLYGIKFHLVTDHKPLEFLFSKRSRPPARIERWVLRMQVFDYTIEYKPGSENIADSLSRLSCGHVQEEEKKRNVAEEYVRFVAQTATPKAMTTRDIEEHSHHDAELCEVRRCIREDAWDNKECAKYFPVREELCIIGKVVLRGTRIVIPQSLRQQVLAIAHEGHVGIVATKLRLRTKVWWPGVDRDAEQYVRSCHGCQLVGQPTSPEPLMPTELPQGKWQDLSLDLLGPMPTGEYLFVVVDYYSRYYEVEILTSVTASQIISRLEKIFAVHGLPVTITSDNGPQFRSEEFEQYLVDNGISHRKVTPLWAQANGEVERQNRSLLKSMRIAQAEGKNWRKELVRFLAAYRTTPHTVTGICPAELLFGRKIRTKLPEFRETAVNDEELRDRDWEKKTKAKTYADARRGAQPNDLQAGDQVLLKKKKSNKLSANFESEPYEIVEKKGNSVVVQSPEKVQYQRNVTEVKKFTPREEQSASSDLEFELQEDNELERRPQRERHPPDRYGEWE